MKTLLIDNYDSFTFNLFQLIAEVNGVPPIVVHNDQAPWSALRALDFDHIVISPGPGRPEVERDFGVCREALLESDVPVLGVCLGHQGLCHLFGGKVDYAAEVVHGRPSDIYHTGQDILKDIPSPFSAIRYHSLLVSAWPEELEKIAWTADGLLMGVRHKQRPLWGVQFHPESICTEYGRQLMHNFLTLTTDGQRPQAPGRRASDGRQRDTLAATYECSPGRETNGMKPRAGSRRAPLAPFEVFYRRIPGHVDAEQAFMNLYAGSCPSFWLDCALVQGDSRFSYMGDTSGPHAEFITYDVNRRRVRVEKGGTEEIHNESIFTHLDRVLRERHVLAEGLPFDFNGGYAGYLGYELKADCGADIAYRAPTADAAFVFADRLVAFDHKEHRAYLVCLEQPGHRHRAEAWLDETSARLLDLEPCPDIHLCPDAPPVPQTFRHTPASYLDLIRACQKEIAHGQSYEICLTNTIAPHIGIDPLNTYRALRADNPAPYAAYLHFPGVSVLSSSPERFLTIDPSGLIQAKPIKGTRRRGTNAEEDEALYQDLRTNEKDRSENLMIVDLLRNDIGSVAVPGTVQVSSLFAVESYATLHQLVSTVKGRLRPGISGVQCVRAAFPGGSMTGAPKKRTMEILDRLEQGPRGIYSGSIGFFGLNGSVDMSIVIRTIVVDPDGISVGVGGAILGLSDPRAELEELMLKAEALIHALSRTALSSVALTHPSP